MHQFFGFSSREVNTGSRQGDGVLRRGGSMYDLQGGGRVGGRDWHEQAIIPQPWFGPSVGLAAGRVSSISPFTQVRGTR